MSHSSSLMQINPDVLAIAERRDSERARGCVRGPLHGIPFTVKDNFATKDNMETTAGSWPLIGNIVPRDAHVVSKLRDAGAVLFGKATMSEWADMRSTDYSEGYSPRGVKSAVLTISPLTLEVAAQAVLLVLVQTLLPFPSALKQTAALSTLPCVTPLLASSPR